MERVFAVRGLGFASIIVRNVEHNRMRDTLKRLMKLTAGYSLVTLIGPLFTILLTPLYTRVLEPADYGVVDIALTLGGLLSIFVMLGMDQALAAHFFDGDDQSKRDMVTTAVLYVIGSGLVICTAVFLFAEPLAVLLYADPTRRITIQLLSLYALFAPLYGVLGAALRLRMGVRRVNLLGLSYLFSFVGLNVLFVLFFQMKATGIIAANVLTNITGAAVGLALVWRPLRGQFRVTLLAQVLQSGLKILPGMLGYVALASIDRLLLTQYVNAQDIGLYSIANKLSSMLYVGFSALWSAWWPIALEMSKRPDAPRQYARIFEYFAAGSMLAALTLGLFAPDILRIFTTAGYVPAAPYAMILMIYSGPLAFMNGSFQISHFVSKRVHWISIASLVSAGVNIVLNLLLNPIYGVWGATWATVIAGVVFASIVYASGRDALFIDYRWLRTTVLVLVYLCLLVFFGGFAGPYTVGSRWVAVFAFVAAIFAVGFVRWSQLVFGLEAAKHWVASLR